MLEVFVAVVIAAIAGGVVGLKVVAPKTKSKVDDKVLKFLEDYGVPLEEYLKAHQK